MNRMTDERTSSLDPRTRARSAAEEILESQRASWDRFSPGWKSWDRFTMTFLEWQGEAIVRRLAPASDAQILDVATGTGEPGIRLAALAPAGRVCAVDLSPKMLRIAEEKARRRGLTNFETRVADACELPYPDARFDAVSCRLGLMFVPDPAEAVREMARVTKPGGRIAVTVWGGPETNSWITTVLKAAAKHFTIPKPPAGSPGMFRCAAPGAVAELLRSAGLTAVEEDDLLGTVRCSSPAEYFEFINDVVPPVVALLENAPTSVRDAIRADVYEQLASTEGSHAELGWGARVASAIKPPA